MSADGIRDIDRCATTVGRAVFERLALLVEVSIRELPAYTEVFFLLARRFTLGILLFVSHRKPVKVIIADNCIVSGQIHFSPGIDRAFCEGMGSGHGAVFGAVENMRRDIIKGQTGRLQHTGAE